ncbi:MAG: phosphatase PAP2 family protein [Acidimicrobiales bacterium]
MSDQRFLPGETGLLEAVNGLPTWLGWPLPVLMQLGTVWVAVAVVAVMALVTRRQGVRPALGGLVAVALAYRLDNVLKDIIERPRPPAVLDGLHVRDHVDGFAFPSGHTTMAFALAAAVLPVVPARWRPAVWILAALIGVARLYVGVHWPMDLVGGAALGIALGTAAVVLVTRYRPSPA